MSEEVTQSTVSAEDQIERHIRKNYEDLRVERGFTWDQMAEQFGKDRNGSLLQSWALERATAEENGDVPDGIETRGELSGEMENADAPELRVRGNAEGLEPVDEIATEVVADEAAEVEEASGKKGKK